MLATSEKCVFLKALSQVTLPKRNISQSSSNEFYTSGFNRRPFETNLSERMINIGPKAFFVSKDLIASELHQP